MQEITTGPEGPGSAAGGHRRARRDFKPTGRTSKTFELLERTRHEQDPDRRAALLAETERAVQDLEVRQALAAARYSVRGLGHAIVLLERALGRPHDHVDQARARLAEEARFAELSLDQLYEAMSRLRQLRPDAEREHWLGLVEIARNMVRMAKRRLPAPDRTS